MATPARLTAERHGSVPRSYVLCSRDRVITPPAQQALAAAQECRLLRLDTGHSPMLEQPEALAELLAALAATVRRG